MEVVCRIDVLFQEPQLVDKKNIQRRSGVYLDHGESEDEPNPTRQVKTGTDQPHGGVQPPGHVTDLD